MPPSKLRVAALLVHPFQFLDLAPIDLFHMLSKQYLRECRLPQPLINSGIDDVEICYVAEDTGKNGDDGEDTVKLADMTASARIQITHGLDDPSIQPGCIDILFIPGPDPSIIPSERICNFVRRHAEIQDTTIMSVCTGVYVLGYSGVLDNKVVTGPRALIGMELKKKFPRAKWRDNNRWEVDSSGRLWTSGGIANGLDMVAAYLKQRDGWGVLAEFVCGFADVGDRAREYGSTGYEDGIWFLWLIARGWIRGIFGGGTRSQKRKVRVE